MLNTVYFDPWQRSLFVPLVSSANTKEKGPLLAGKAKVETDILSQSVIKPLVCKRFIDDIFSLWNVSRDEISKFIEQANKHHPTIKFTAEIPETETTFLDNNVYKGERLKKAAVLDVHTHPVSKEVLLKGRL